MDESQFLNSHYECVPVGDIEESALTFVVVSTQCSVSKFPSCISSSNCKTKQSVESFNSQTKHAGKSVCVFV